MTADHDDVGGKGFAPTERNVDESDEETAATLTHGSGKQFAPSVGDPASDESARQTEGSGEQFAWDVEQPEEEPRGEATRGSGKQFRPERDER
ncbi:MAG: hypothetical protein ICV72_06765 [Aldersonia sp.]|nr:hypothetical protein [Aldersonia sp.]